MDRRKFLRGVGCCGAASLCTSLVPSFAHAAGNSGNGTKVLFINLNGGLDGTYALHPSGGATLSTLASLRPTLTLNPATLLTASSEFGLHPNLSVFKSLYDEGKLIAVNRVGIRNMSRSHLDAETAVARGVPDRLTSASSGFLNRLGAHYGWDSLQAVSVSGNDLAFEGGDYRGMQARSLESLYFKDIGTGGVSERMHLVASAASMAQDGTVPADKPKHGDVHANLLLTINNTDMIHSAVLARTPPTTYPIMSQLGGNNYFGRALKDADVLFTSSGFTTQVAYMRVGGFDTHSNQQAGLSKLLLDLNDALAAFVSNMKAANIWNNLIVMVYSEFGRTNRENGSGGTDHGGANTVFLLGGAVAGGSVIGDVAPTHLTASGWLQVRYNMVDVYRRIIARMGLDPDPIFAVPQEEALTGMFT